MLKNKKGKKEKMRKRVEKTTPSGISFMRSQVSYRCAQVCADGAGADQVTLDGVYHSPLGAVIAVDGKVGRPWYGSPEILPKWIHHISCDESDSMVELGDTLPPNL